MLDENFAWKFERESKYEEAGKAWRTLERCASPDYKDHYKKNAEACELIVLSSKVGDEFRNRIKGVNEDLENRDITRRDHNRIINEIYEEVRKEYEPLFQAFSYNK